MAAQEILDALAAQVEKNKTVEGSAAVLINGFSARLQAAVDAALANGATAEQLAPITDEVTALNSSATDLAAAVAANTPATP